MRKSSIKVDKIIAYELQGRTSHRDVKNSEAQDKHENAGFQ